MPNHPHSLVGQGQDPEPTQSPPGIRAVPALPSRPMKLVVINLPRAKSRRAAMEVQLDRLGLEAEFHPGTDWRDLTEADGLEVDHESRARQGRRPLSPGMIACHLSHRRVLRNIACGAEEQVAVLEDDAELAPDLTTVLLALEGWPRRAEFDLVFLHRNRPQLPFWPVASVDHRLRTGLVKYCDWGTQSYVITREAARKFLARHPRIIHRTDHTLHGYWLNGLNVVYLDPPVISHGAGETGGSLLQESAKVRPPRPPRGRVRRVGSHVSEEVRKRVCYFRRRRQLTGR